MFLFSELNPKVQSTIIEEMRDKNLSDNWFDPVMERFRDKIAEFVYDPLAVELHFKLFGDTSHFGVDTKSLLSQLDPYKLAETYLDPKLEGLSKFFGWKFFQNIDKNYGHVGYFFYKGEENKSYIPGWRTSPNYTFRAELIEKATPPNLGQKVKDEIHKSMAAAFNEFWEDLMGLCKETYRELLEEYEFQTSDKVIIERLNSMQGVMYTAEGHGIVLRGDEHTAYADENKEEIQYVVLNTVDESNPQLVVDDKGNTKVFANKAEADAMLKELVSGSVLPLNYLLQTAELK